MNKHSINTGSRPARDDLEVPLEFEPDTPMHHNFRNPHLAWKSKLVRSAQILIAFLLVAAAGVWFFIDVEDLHHSSRLGESSMNTAQSFPDGYMGVEDTSITRSRALSRAESLGVYVDEHEGEKLVSTSAEERWAARLDNITVQPLVHVMEQPSRSSKVVLLTPSNCNSFTLDEEQVSRCYQHLMEACASMADIQCYLAAASESPCNVPKAPEPSYSNAYMAGLRRAIPYLRELGWTHIVAKEDFADPARRSNCPVNTTETEETIDALKVADIVMAESYAVKDIWHVNPEVRVIILDGDAQSVLSDSQASQLDDERILGIWRAQTLALGSLQNGPLLNGSAYLAKLEGASDERDYQANRQQNLSTTVLNKVIPILSHALRYRYPFDLGGSSQHARFIGAFEQNTSHWAPKRMAQRQVDVAFMPHLTPANDLTALSPGAQKVLTSHRNSLTKILKEMQTVQPELNIQVTSSNSGTYEEYLQQLQDTKILIVPGGISEWSEQDFDAIFMGCLVMKVQPSSIRLYPDIFTSEFMLEAQSDWQGVQETLVDTLKDIEHAQRMADRTVNRLLEFSDMRRYAASIEENLLAVSVSS